MPDFTNPYKRNTFRIKLYNRAVENVRKRHPELKENSEQFKRAVQKVLRHI